MLSFFYSYCCLCNRLTKLFIAGLFLVKVRNGTDMCVYDEKGGETK